MEKREIITAATEVGYQMLRFGAEVFRVEQAIEFICNAYDVAEVDVFAIPNSIVVTISDEQQFFTKTKRVKRHTINLDRVDQFNSLSREICQNKPDLAAIKEEIDRILRRPKYGPVRLFMAYCMVSFFFSLFYGGTLRDGLAALIIGGIVRLLVTFLERIHTNSFLMTILCSAAMTALTIVSVKIGLGDETDTILIGVLMTLVPGVALANCMRDFIANDIVAGLSRLAQALLTASGIAIGVFVVLLATT